MSRVMLSFIRCATNSTNNSTRAAPAMAEKATAEWAKMTPLPTANKQMATPRLAPELIPKTDGPASGFRKSVCTRRPLHANAAPLIAAVSAAGIRLFQMILCQLALALSANKVLNTSPGGICTEPMPILRQNSRIQTNRRLGITIAYLGMGNCCGANLRLTIFTHREFRTVFANSRLMKKLLVLLIVVVIGSIFILPTLFHTGKLRFNYPDLETFPVQGIDVSHHQGPIDWSALPKERVRFAFIKATEGGDHKDKRFEKNWEAALEAGIVPGGYHFFSFCKSGSIQAANIIESVPKESGTLPPVIDLEYSENCNDRPDKATFIKELTVLSDSLQSYYGLRPILYSTPTFYKEYLDGEMQDHFYWARDVYGQPEPSDGREWQFWQFTDKGELTGVQGPVDLNVFNGDFADLERILLR